jgi:hypothetical protein
MTVLLCKNCALLLKDALRYRYIRSLFPLSGEMLDRSIDHYMTSAQPTVNEKTAAVDALRELQQESQRMGLYDEPEAK